jgi:ATP-binding cassette, subfamily B, bacterial
MKYTLAKSDTKKQNEKKVLITAWQRLTPFLVKEKRSVIIALIAISFSAVISLLLPIIIAHIVDTYIVGRNFSGVLLFSGLLFLIFILGFISNYVQIINMGGVGRRLIFNLRNKLFDKLQELPIAFFNQNKTGDLISRINSDTEKINQFFSQALMQFFSNLFLIAGTGVFIFLINSKLSLIALFPAAIALIITKLLSAWVKKNNLKSLRALGELSGEIQESINNFKVIVAFNRLDYFRNKFKKANDENYSASISAGIANNIFNPIFVLASSFAQLAVLAYGIYLISLGDFTIGLLIGFLLYVNNFYSPLRQLASVWSSLQLALAALDRISEVLSFETDLTTLSKNKNIKISSPKFVLEFENVFFRYEDSRKNVLENINFKLERGKTYALVGPTGGGKTTTASLMARLCDPEKGTVYLAGKDIRIYDSNERTEKIGFILQDPFLFNGTVQENILYGNKKYQKYNKEKLTQTLKRANLTKLLSRFPEGLETKIVAGGDSISLGQKQLIAFIRAVLRNPEILILDEATANVDTVTEELLEEIINKLPKKTTKVIIAHRLNTIEHADEIFFVNSTHITHASSMQIAVEMLSGKDNKS